MALYWLLTLSNVVILLLICGTLIRFACRVVLIQGKSMQPALEEGCHVLVLDWWPKRYVRKGQIVVLRSLYTSQHLEGSIPYSENKNHIYMLQDLYAQLHVKRIVALGGETVATSLDDLAEEVRSRYMQYHDARGIRSWSIPSGHLFVRGDNHSNSVDSLLAGPLPIQSVCGIVVMKLPEVLFH